jgi:outer membrane protein assembly factor BamD (BamD/ComL family)
LDNVFVSAQTDIEEMFYIRQDYSGAIQYIDQFLSSAPPETRDWYECVLDVCKYYPEWYVPYFRYLRGLAYEQLEEDDQAKQAYYELWTDFPNSIFGVAASLKLELVNP